MRLPHLPCLKILAMLFASMIPLSEASHAAKVMARLLLAHWSMTSQGSSPHSPIKLELCLNSCLTQSFCSNRLAYAGVPHDGNKTKMVLFLSLPYVRMDVTRYRQKPTNMLSCVALHWLWGKGQTPVKHHRGSWQFWTCKFFCELVICFNDTSKPTQGSTRQNTSVDLCL